MPPLGWCLRWPDRYRDCNAPLQLHGLTMQRPGTLELEPPEDPLIADPKLYTGGEESPVLLPADNCE